MEGFQFGDPNVDSSTDLFSLASINWKIIITLDQSSSDLKIRFSYLQKFCHSGKEKDTTINSAFGDGSDIS